MAARYGARDGSRRSPIAHRCRVSATGLKRTLPRAANPHRPFVIAWAEARSKIACTVRLPRGPAAMGDRRGRYTRCGDPDQASSLRRRVRLDVHRATAAYAQRCRTRPWFSACRGSSSRAGAQLDRHRPHRLAGCAPSSAGAGVTSSWHEMAHSQAPLHGRCASKFRRSDDARSMTAQAAWRWTRIRRSWTRGSSRPEQG